MDGESHTTLHLPEFKQRPGPRALLVFGLVGAPTAWLVHLVAQVALVGAACDGGRALLVLPTVVLLPIAIGATWAATVVRADPMRGGADPETEASTRTLGRIGLALGWLFSVAIVLGAVPILLLDPCGSP